MIDGTFEKEFLAVSSLSIRARLWAAAPGCRSTVATLPNFRLRSWSLPVGRAVRNCCAVVRAGWIAWQALVIEARGRSGLGFMLIWHRRIFLAEWTTHDKMKSRHHKPLNNHSMNL